LVKPLSSSSSSFGVLFDSSGFNLIGGATSAATPLDFPRFHIPQRFTINCTELFLRFALWLRHFAVLYLGEEVDFSIMLEFVGLIHE
jgi:hypothetical protein